MITYKTYSSVDTRNLQFEKKNAILFFASIILYGRSQKLVAWSKSEFLRVACRKKSRETGEIRIFCSSTFYITFPGSQWAQVGGGQKKDLLVPWLCDSDILYIRGHDSNVFFFQLLLE